MQTGIPQAIGIDLSGTNINDSGYSLPALVVGQVDKYGAIQAPIITDDTNLYQFNQRYLCLGADNNIYIVHAFNIAAIAEDCNNQDILSLWSAASEVIRDRASSLHQNSWITLEKQVLRADGDPQTASILSQCIPSAASMVPIVPSQEGIDALEEQKRRIRAVRAEIDDLKGNIGFTKASKKRAAAFTKAGKLLDEASMLRSQLDAKLSGGWKQFERILRVLETTEALYRPSTVIQENSDSNGDANRDIVGNEPSFSSEDQDGSQLRYQFAPLGLVARELRGSNELWMALALTHPSLQSLAYPQLAAVVSAIVSGDAVSKLTASSAYPPSLSVSEAISQLEDVRSELSLAQIQAGIDFPLWLDPSLSGVVEAWASGLGWAEVTGDCNLDDGDVARLLMRTVDALRQAAFCDHLLPPLRSAARTAARRMNRPPISELFT
jgi:superfamily II RNA helicase